ncbi:Lrp/AsnC family transcriptional regulator [Paenactinomyces guangxiensis]|uniref:Lrp/AsnC family transcriptional regulator n=1 Tax=Paenactinomyces guangxiensis TaxID=1490290 RepID=A0A7W1WT51_9BACL|nr:Lrp/AsnC family transcriptional regulator [Paenactinomyces guangxiensis]MBA4495523.1 Lrp/AsnC family transcriptional regulator [Paenactinomyces guangxiensis]MBH8592781.1 Lrp/AsnC family transcriptional regulator [Paenactinomyces guangxiensis]
MSEQLQHEILSLLEEDSRLDQEQIAHMLGESKENVAQTIQELQEKGVIVKYGAVINWQKSGKQRVSALIDVKVTPQRGYGFDALAKRIYLFPEVRSVYLMSGAYDLSVALEVDSMEAVGRFVEKLATLDSVVATTTHFVLKKYKEDGVILDDPETDQRLVISP